MSYVLHGATLALAWFLVTNVALAALAALAALTRGACPEPGRGTARRAGRSPSLPLALRLFPAAASAAFVAGVFVPSYWRFEPRDFVEGFDVTLTMLAAGAALLLAGSCARGAGAWWRAARRARAWTRTAEPLDLKGVNGIGVPAFRIDAPQAVMALVGILRPRLLVTRGLIDALTPEELAASIAHEAAHHRAWDNLKRLAMLGAPDLLRGTSVARRLEHEWAASAEHMADAAASEVTGRAARLALASALVKVARLVPPPAPIAEPISTLLGGGEIAERVQHLIDDGPERAAPRPRGLSSWAVRCAAAAAAIAFGYGYAPLLAAVHTATEILVHRLP